jgi:hypothetical protein
MRIVDLKGAERPDWLHPTLPMHKETAYLAGDYDDPVQLRDELDALKEQVDDESALHREQDEATIAELTDEVESLRAECDELKLAVAARNARIAELEASLRQAALAEARKVVPFVRG